MRQCDSACARGQRRVLGIGERESQDGVVRGGEGKALGEERGECGGVAQRMRVQRRQSERCMRAQLSKSSRAHAASKVDLTGAVRKHEREVGGERRGGLLRFFLGGGLPGQGGRGRRFASLPAALALALALSLVELSFILVCTGCDRHCRDRFGQDVRVRLPHARVHIQVGRPRPPACDPAASPQD